LKTLRPIQYLLLVAGCTLWLCGCNDQGSAPTASTAVSTPSDGTSSATLSWEAPTANTNGSALTDLAGYRIYYGSSPSQMNQMVQIKTTGVQTYVIDNLAAGTWYFAIMAVTSAGTESGLSNVVSYKIG
jgi:fibronectin type 3 domain-containing protein